LLRGTEEGNRTSSKKLRGLSEGLSCDNHEARELIKRIALEELGFKCALEKVLLGETLSFQADAAQGEIIVKLPSDLKKDALDEIQPRRMCCCMQ